MGPSEGRLERVRIDDEDARVVAGLVAVYIDPGDVDVDENQDVRVVEEVVLSAEGESEVVWVCPRDAD